MHVSNWYDPRQFTNNSNSLMSSCCWECNMRMALNLQSMFNSELADGWISNSQSACLRVFRRMLKHPIRPSSYIQRRRTSSDLILLSINGNVSPRLNGATARPTAPSSRSACWPLLICVPPALACCRLAQWLALLSLLDLWEEGGATWETLVDCSCELLGFPWFLGLLCSAVGV